MKKNRIAKALRDCAHEKCYNDNCEYMGYGYPKCVTKMQNEAADVLEATPEETEWKICGHFKDRYGCTKCHARYLINEAKFFKYCPNCGRKVVTHK